MSSSLAVSPVTGKCESKNLQLKSQYNTVVKENGEKSSKINNQKELLANADGEERKLYSQKMDYGITGDEIYRDEELSNL